MGRCFDYTALTLVIIGAVNWGLIGFFKLDLVNLLFGNIIKYIEEFTHVVWLSTFP